MFHDNLINKITNKLSRLYLGLLLIGLVVLSSFSLAIPTIPAQAATNASFLQVSIYKCIIPNKTGCDDSNSLVPALRSFLIAIAPVIVTLVIIIGGYEWIIGDESAKKTKASTTILSAMGGYVIIILAPMIADVLQKTFGNEPSQGFNAKPVNDLLEQIIELLLTLSGVVAVFAIVLAGYGFFVEYFYNESRSQGKINPRELLMSGVTGLVVVTLARPVVGFINSTLSADKTSVTINNDFIVSLIQNILAKFLIPLSSLVAVFFLVIAGYYWITANGDDKKITSAQQMFKNSIIGIVVVLLSTTMVQLIVFFIKPASGFIPGAGSSNTLMQTTKAPSKPATTTKP